MSSMIGQWPSINMAKCALSDIGLGITHLSRKWIYVLFIWISLCASAGSEYYGIDQADYFGECNKYLYNQKIEPRTNRLIELHIRHNFRGFVEIRDGSYNSKKISIDIEKTGPSEEEIVNVMMNKSYFDVGRGNIFVVQLDHVKKHSRTVTIVIGAAIAGAIFLTLASLLIWWYYRKRNPHFSPIHAQGLTAGTLDGKETTYEEELVESTLTTPVHRVNGGTQGTQSCPPPPPPCRGDPTYMTAAEARSGMTAIGSPRTSSRAGVGSPRGLSKTTVVALSVVMVISVVYAACPYDVQARVIIIIPPLIKLDHIKIFFNKNFHNELYTNGWEHKNGTKVDLYDLDDASPTHNRPCEGDCPAAKIQNMVGCDAATRKCVCQHGYELVKGVCFDVDECSSGQHQCPPTASCQNTFGGYTCQCGYGFYGDRRTCKPCSVGCPAGFYESSPCTNFGDRVCKECTKCKGAKYEARPCGETTDRQCMHVAHPLLIAGDKTTPVLLDGLKVQASDNVFLEDLHNIRNLETTYYVTDTTQAYDFSWKRDSGLEVNIGVLKIHLIPEYEDVEHESDNKYMIDNPNNSKDKAKFRHIMQEQCRNPIPDYYSVTLEISRDRTTTAKEVVCDSKDPTGSACPDDNVDGDVYLHRTLNDACPKMGTFPEDLKPAPNSIVCTENTALLRDIFNQSYTMERPIKFPPRRCKTAQARCDQCLDQARCRSKDTFVQKCCQIDCYTLPDCKMAQSEECTSSPVECAMGDAYRYTVQPVFQNIKQHYMCHIKRKEPKILYQMFFYVKIPSKGFQTPKAFKTIYAQDLQYQSQGEYNADYINVEHSTGLNLREEFILIGQESGPDGHFNHSVHMLKEPNDYRKKKVVIHEISPNIYVASTQFERPFDYSTSSWNVNQCNKNISKFQKVQRHYGTEGQPVDVNAQKDPEGGAFTYYLKATDPDPFIRFKGPGNMSILPYYFRDNGPRLLTDNSLKASLNLVSSQRIWQIHITGRMTNCPAYLGLTINNRIDLEEILRYDMLILCQPEIPEPVFNLTFKIPNWGQDPDKTFDIRLEDAAQSYDIYLTQMIFEQQRLEPSPKMVKMPQAPSMSTTLFAIVGGVTVVILFFMLIAFIYIEHTKAKLVYDNSVKTRNAYTESHKAPSTREVDPPPSCASGSVLDQKQTVFIGIYIFMRIVYSLLFTFTVFFAVLMLFIDGDLKQLSKLDTYQGEKYNSTVALGNKIDQYSQGELLRQGELVTSMQGACSHYIGELFDTMTKEMDNVTANQHQLDMYGEDSSISFLMHVRARHAMDAYGEALDNYTNSYRDLVRSNIKPFLTRYQHYMKKIFQNDWYKFPQHLFNQSSSPLERPKYVRNSEEFSGQEVDFGIFLEVEEVEKVQLWDIQYWEKFLNSLPDLPSLPVPKVDHQVPECHLSNQQTSMATSSLSNHTALDRLTSAQFISSQIVTEEYLSRGPKYTGSHFAEEYKFVAPSKEDAGHDMVFSVEEFITSINIELLRIIFLIMDGILLLYRFSHTYMNSTMLCRGFEDNVHQKAASPDGAKAHSSHATAQAAQSPSVTMGTPVSPSSQQTYSTLTSRSSHYPDEGTYVETTIPDYAAPLNGQRSGYLHPVTQVTHTIDPSYVQPSYGQNIAKMPAAANSNAKYKDHNFEVLKQSVARLVLSTTLPKVLVATALMVLFYLLIRAVTLYLDVFVISQLEGFSVFLGALDIQLNQTNWYLMDQASHFNDVTMKIYEGQMMSELLNLKSMVDYFNSEQHRLVKNYITEACAITRQHQLNWTCGVEMKPPLLHVPMLPCNFVPIQPELYTDFNSDTYERELGRSFEPYICAARNIVLKTGHALFIIITAMLVIHVLGAVLFHFLKTRHKFPVRKVFISSTPPGGQCGIQNPVQGEESEYDTDEVDAGGGAYATYATPTRVRMSPQKSNTLTTDFKYSETKV